MVMIMTVATAQVGKGDGGAQRRYLLSTYCVSTPLVNALLAFAHYLSSNI